MTRDQVRRQDEATTSEGGGTAGKRTRVEGTYPTLARAMRADGESPTIHDAATAAVEGKGGGAPVDGAVAAQVGAHLGTDLGGVRVHQDDMAQEASAAMGARAFAHGTDVFLGAGESATDLGLMAHELTHVAQQGGAGQRALQRKVEVGDANSPAEHQADAVASAVTGGAAPAALLVDDGPVAAGQMLKSAFLAELREQVTAAADAELGPLYTALGCPLIDQYLQRYAARPAAEGEAMLRRFAPAVAGAHTAAAMIPATVARVRVGVRHWRDTGEPPPEVAGLEPAAPVAAPAGPAAAQALRAPDGRETLASLEAALGPGTAVDGAVASRMSGALGVDVGGARIHTGPVAAAKADEAGAVAFAAGTNVVLGAGAPAAGTLEGDALLAHELAHTAQQADAAGDPAARRQPLGAESSEAEDAADRGAAGALAAQHGAERTGASMWRELSKTGLQLQRCEKITRTRTTPSDGTFTTVAPTVRAAPDAPSREAALAVGITGATTRLADLKSITGSSSGPIAALRQRIIAETGVGNSAGPAPSLDANPYVSLNASHIESAWRAWGENPSAATEPWTLLAVWMKEGLSAAPAPNTIPANDATDARAIYRSQSYYQNMGADHYIHFTATAGDNAADFAPGTGAAHDTAFRAAIAAQLAAGRLPRDIGPEIDAELTVTAVGSDFTVTPGPRFQALSLLLVDAYWRESRGDTSSALGARGMSAAGDDLDAMTYMRWNMGSGRFNTMLGRDMSGNQDPDGSTPPLPTWALHREVRSGEWHQPRANAIRFQYYQQAYRYIFEAGY